MIFIAILAAYRCFTKGQVATRYLKVGKNYSSWSHHLYFTAVYQLFNLVSLMTRKIFCAVQSAKGIFGNIFQHKTPFTTNKSTKRTMKHLSNEVIKSVESENCCWKSPKNFVGSMHFSSAEKQSAKSTLIDQMKNKIYFEFTEIFISQNASIQLIEIYGLKQLCSCESNKSTFRTIFHDHNNVCEVAKLIPSYIVIENAFIS